VILPDADVCYRAVTGRDPRFDGWFFTAVHTTGIYCRPSCPAITPRRRNVTFYPSAAAAQRAGFRACKRCRPDACPGSPEWDVRGDLAGRALRLIADGVIDREGVAGLSRRLGYSERQVNRTLLAEVGAGPIALARAQRAQTARVLLETTDLPAADIAFAAGFASVRQFNDTVRAVFAMTPTGLRTSKRRAGMAPTVGLDPLSGREGDEGAGAIGNGSIVLRLPYRAPMDLDATLAFLGERAIPGVESYDGQEFTRVLRAAGGPALVSLSAGDGAVTCRVALTDHADLVSVVARIRRLLDLDADPAAVDTALAADPVLASLVRKHPGLRTPGAVDGFELAVRAVIGQQISVRGARTLLGRIATELGDAVGNWRLFPSAERFATIDPATLPMPRARATTLLAVAAACASGELTLDPGADRDQERARLLAIPGVGPWTADYLLMRAMGAPDVLLSSDLGVRKAAVSLGLDLDGGGPDWAPWRSYATFHLWTSLH
jgi:AraC family transcriptional regulator of adaptative response / DNA-3-methyladenine glycosylase II